MMASTRQQFESGTLLLKRPCCRTEGAPSSFFALSGIVFVAVVLVAMVVLETEAAAGTHHINGIDAENQEGSLKSLSVRMATPEAERYFELVDAVLVYKKESQHTKQEQRQHQHQQREFKSEDLRVLRELLKRRRDDASTDAAFTDGLRLRHVWRVPVETCGRRAVENEEEEEEEVTQVESRVCLSLLMDSRKDGTRHYHLWYQTTLRDMTSKASLTTMMDNDETSETRPSDVLFEVEFELMGPFSSYDDDDDCSSHCRKSDTPLTSRLTTSTMTTSVASYPPVNNGSDSINELIELSREAVCERDVFTGECKQGTVQPANGWLQWALSDQRNRSIEAMMPVPYLTIVSTHNSYNNKADGYGDGDFTLAKLLELISDGQWDFVWAQQYFTMTDQLNLGSRSMMLDPVWFDEAVRLCHCGTTFPWFDKVSS